MDAYGKSLATIEESDSGNPNGGFTAVLSTPSMDRDGDTLKRTEWIEPLPPRLPLDADHGMTVADTIGSFTPYFDDAGRLMMDATFASTPKAQEVRTLIKEGHISTVSVAFMNDKTAQKDGKPHRELLNAGVVAIPSNRDAVILESKALDARAKELAEQKVDSRKGIIVTVTPQIDEAALKRVTEQLLEKAAGGQGGDIALLQAIHDASVHLGAQCAACDELHADDVPAAPAAAKPAPKSVEETETKTAAIAEPVTFTNASGEAMTFDSQESAREFFDSMLTSIVDADENGETVVEVIETSDETSSTAQDAGSPQGTETESPANEPAPVDETAAASDAAEEVAGSAVAVDEQDLVLAFPDMFAFALTSGSSD